MTFVDYFGRVGWGKLGCSAFLASQCSVPLDSPPKLASDTTQDHIQQEDHVLITCDIKYLLQYSIIAGLASPKTHAMHSFSYIIFSLTLLCPPEGMGRSWRGVQYQGNP